MAIDSYIVAGDQGTGCTVSKDRLTHLLSQAAAAYHKNRPDPAGDSFTDLYTELRSLLVRLYEAGNGSMIDRLRTFARTLKEHQVVSLALDHLMDIQRIEHKDGATTMSELWALPVFTGWLQEVGGEPILRLNSACVHELSKVFSSVLGLPQDHVVLSQTLTPLSFLSAARASERMEWLSQVVRSGGLKATGSHAGRFQAMALLVVAFREPEAVRPLHLKHERHIEVARRAELVLHGALAPPAGAGGFFVKAGAFEPCSMTLRWGWLSYVLSILQAARMPRTRIGGLELFLSGFSDAEAEREAATVHFLLHPHRPDPVCVPVRPWERRRALDCLRRGAPAGTVFRLPS